ncbi:MAG: thioredoxin domain-containing protein [Rhodospirillaceae bacterium]|nr:thioredoxin domain-containing protein [Rhodospirillaceae bacterium]
MSESRNRLGSETSPYLRQHQANPVHWWAWGDDAFAAARTQNKPILLSVGYAACHWCHVMAHESFEDPATAALMNAHFINIKVDREERPDVDAIYQKALAVMGESGGWPLTMFIMPDGQPFWGGTYFPISPRYGRPGFQQVLTQLSRVWAESRDKIIEQADGLTAAITHRSGDELRDGLSMELLDNAADHLLEFVDQECGGLSGAPKFPMPFVWEFVWRAYRRTGDARLKSAVTLTLDNICQGGIYDHLGGGFARYSTDPRWLAPHFEKMLYDNAQLIGLFTLVWQEARKPLYAARIAETISWLEREMVGENGAYVSAFDADSEGEEGKFYVWTEAEVDAALGSNSASFKKAYDATPAGNWEGHTILNRLNTMVFDEAEDKTLAPARATLLKARETRIPPGRDDKILADWNGLAIESLARAAMAFDCGDWLNIATRLYTAVVSTMAWRDAAGRDRLGHSLCGGVLQRVDLLDDYANMANAALMLNMAAGEPRYLADAERWIGVVNDLFSDDTGGYFFTPSDRADLIVRTKTAHDCAQPSGNGAMALALARLYALTGIETYRTQAALITHTFAGEAFKVFPHAATVLNGFDLLTNPISVVIAGRRGDAKTDALIRAAWSVSEANLVLMVMADGRALPAAHPAHGKMALDGQAAAYVCRGLTCSAPVTDPAALVKLLSPGH